MQIDPALAVWLGIGIVETFFPIRCSNSPMAALSAAPGSPGKKTISADRTTRVVAVASFLHIYCLHARQRWGHPSEGEGEALRLNSPI